MKHAITRTVSRLVPTTRQGGVRILLYHAVGRADPYDRLALHVSPDAFRAQMELLRAEGYQVVSLSSLLDGGSPDSATRVAITFDDGYRSQLLAADILDEFKFPATFFLVSRFLDGERVRGEYWDQWEHLRWNELRSLLERGFEIGGHSASHVPLTRCPSSVLQGEVVDVKASLEDRLGCQVMSFSYPHGAFNQTVVDTVKQAGYQLACTSLYGVNRTPQSWFALRRIEITGEDRLSDFRSKLLGKYDWLRAWQRWQATHA